ncbi:amidase [Oceaniglobus roseus]|uniref:amidase n=1 Tax=Oceaniglobus roseus TaxID=1737570 RepID=UPI000C7F6CFE|nr:amidase family protein [Kandeliimicrobium roseum]
MSNLAALAAEARGAGDRLLHARRLAGSGAMAEARRLNAIVTPAPGAPEGPDGPLFGVPVTVKDAFETAGLRTTASHPPLSGHVPQTDAAMVTRLRDTGAVLIGKTNLAELCGDIQTRSPIFGDTPNPWDETRTAGGSGGGGAVAVALGASRLDLGSDLGGSVRIPAAFTGVCALKTSKDLWPLGGHIPPLPGGTPAPFQALGLTARDIADLSQGFAALSGGPVPTPAAAPLGLAMLADFGLPLCPRTEAALALARDRLERAGHGVSRAEGIDVPAALASYGATLGAPSAPHVRPWQRPLLRGLAAGAPHRTIRAAMLRAMADGDTAHAESSLRAVTAQLDAVLADRDALICPVTPTAAFVHAPPPRLPLASRRIASGDKSLPYLEGSIGCCVLASLTGCPAVVLPIDVVDGLPVGLQIIARAGAERRLLAIAAAVEAAFAPHRPAPYLTLAERGAT